MATLPTTSASSSTSHPSRKTPPKVPCGQGTCDVVDKLSNIVRHRKVCPRMPREQFKLMERTCQLCGQLISAKKLLKKHYNTKYCKEQQKRKAEGLPTRMYQYAAARGLKRKPSICYGRGCGKSYVYPYDLRVHLLKNPQCLEGANAAVPVGSDSSSNTEELLRPEDFNHLPPDVFGSDGFFKFAMEVPLDYEFPVAQWEGNVEDHVFKFNSLMRHSVPLLWRGGVKHCHGLKLPKVEELAFSEVVAELLVPHKLQSSAATINVKSAKIGESRDLSLDEFKQELINADRSSVYYPLNAIDIAMQPKSIYSVPTMIKKSSVNHLVDALVSKSEEPFSVATSYYLLVSNDGCQTTWHTDFSSTSVFYTVLTGSKTFFLVAPTDNNMELFNTWSKQERDDFPTFFGCHKRLEGGCLRVTLNPGDIFAMPSQYIHTVLTCGDSVAVGTNFLSEGHSTQIMKAIIEEDSFKDHEKFPGMLEMLAILMLKASERCMITPDFLRLHSVIENRYEESEAVAVYPNFSKERLVYNICSRKEFVNDVRVAAFTETASQQAYLACPKPCFRRRNWVTNEDGVSVPKEAISEERLTFLCQRPASDVDEPNRDVFISFEEVITYVHPRPSQTVRGLHKSPKKEPSFKTVNSDHPVIATLLRSLAILSLHTNDHCYS